MIQAEALPCSFATLAKDHYLPLAKEVASWSQESSQPLVVGINGAQGTGKSTLSKVLALALKHDHQLRSAIISIDDIYLTREERIHLAETVHPLLKTRGVPGTHDVAMGVDLIQKLKNKQPVQLPTFDKAHDDRTPQDEWLTCDEPVDIILFEGWCVGAKPVSTDALDLPCNDLEKTEDKDGTWRKFANQQLTQPYTELFKMIDRLVLLKAPNFECVYEWRSTQEEKLRQRTTPTTATNIMNESQIKRFIMHYERLTRWMLEEMPQRAECVLELNPQHNIIKTKYNRL